jgi:hypothetical protein
MTYALIAIAGFVIVGAVCAYVMLDFAVPDPRAEDWWHKP